MTAETPRAASHPVAVRGLAPGTGEGKAPVPGTTLTPAQLDLVIDALSDAAEYWDLADCARCGPVLCADCKAGAQKRIRYASLALRLSKAAGP
jgi:hypothetical protein